MCACNQSSLNILLEKSNRKKCEIAKEFNVSLITLPLITKQKNKMLMFNNGNIKKNEINAYYNEILELYLIIKYF